MIQRFLTVIFIVLASAGFSQTLSADLQMPDNVEVGSDFIVKITITKSNISGFMKFHQKLPPNYIATAVDANGGAFICKDGMVKIIWLSPPSEDAFSFSYKLKVPADAKSEEPFVAGIDYTIELKSESFTFSDKFIRIGQTSSDAGVVLEKTEEAAPSETPAPPAVEKVEETSPPVVQKETITEENYTYSVQIGAYASTPPKYNGLRDLKKIKLSNGITKYVTGNYTIREEAEKRKNELRASGYKDAFIIKLKNGKFEE
jgi:hypothetical protein